LKLICERAFPPNLRGLRGFRDTALGMLGDDYAFGKYVVNNLDLCLAPLNHVQRHRFDFKPQYVLWISPKGSRGRMLLFLLCRMSSMSEEALFSILYRQ
jgi:hypothetical protein